MLWRRLLIGNLFDRPPRTRQAEQALGHSFRSLFERLARGFSSRVACELITPPRDAIPSCLLVRNIAVISGQKMEFLPFIRIFRAFPGRVADTRELDLLHWVSINKIGIFLIVTSCFSIYRKTAVLCKRTIP